MNGTILVVVGTQSGRRVPVRVPLAAGGCAPEAMQCKDFERGHLDEVGIECAGEQSREHEQRDSGRYERRCRDGYGAAAEVCDVARASMAA